MQDTLVSFETAKLAYEKGFNVDDKGQYVPMYGTNGELVKEKLGYNIELPEVFNKYWILAPTQSFLQKWLRDVHNLHINPFISSALDSKEYSVAIQKPNPIGTLGTSQYVDETPFKSYEEALEDGLLTALNIIL